MTIEIRTRGSKRPFPFALSRSRLEPGGPPLVVRGGAIALVVAGRARLRSAGLSRRLGEGGLALVPPGRGASWEAEEDCELLVARWEPGFLEAVSALLPASGALDPLREGPEAGTRCATLSAEEAASLRAAAGRLEAESREAESREEAGASGPMLLLLAAELLLLAARAASRAASRAGPRAAAAPARAGPAEGTSPGSPWSIEDALRHIEERYSEAFSLEFFVSRCALNTSDFSRRFKEAAGCPLFEFINRQRIKRACALLKNGELPVIEIALAVGYNNLSFFNRYFQRIMGTTPREYRWASRK